MKNLSVFTALIGLTLAMPAFAGSASSGADAPIDPASAEALARTQSLLKDANARAAAVAETPQGRYVDKNVQSIAGNAENSSAIYELSGDILESIAKETGGDPAKMKALLDQAKNDPKAFAEKFTPEQRAKLESIARRIPASAITAPVAAPQP